MRLSKRINIFIITVFCGSVFFIGCGPEQPAEPLSIEQAQTVDLALKYEPNDVTTYKVVTEDERSIKFEGTPSKEVKFENTRNYQKVEIIFDQLIRSVTDDGVATAKIIIKELRYQKIHKNKQLIDYDSNREDQKDYPFGKLIGENYFIELSPTGKIAKIISTSRAERAARGKSSAHQMALSLVNRNTIERRHSIKGLPPVNNKKDFRIGEQWSESEDVSFDMMGAKSYEKIYSLEKISNQQGRATAVIKMTTIPTAGNAEDEYKENEKSSLTEMFDSSDSFSGETIVDSDTGRVEKCSEKLVAQWTVINPSGEQGKEPSALIMTNLRSYSLERIK